MQQKRRSQLDIIQDFLLNLNASDIKRTRLLFKLNVSHKLFIDYLGFLVGKGFIRELGEKSKVYQITDKGKELLDDINAIVNKLK